MQPRLVGILLVLGAAGCTSGTVVRETRSPLPDSGALRAAVSAESIGTHLERFQDIADGNGGNRAAGLPGHDASAGYVADALREAGYEVTLEEFTIPVFEQVVPSQLEVVDMDRPAATAPFVDGDDFKAMVYSGSGEVDARAVFVGLDPGAAPDEFTGAGCDAADFAGFPQGAIAVVQAGPCFRRDQVLSAQAAGASAIVVSYPGWSGGAVRRPTLISPLDIAIPAVSASNDMGQALWAAARDGSDRLTLHLSVTARSEERLTTNVLAETADGDDGNVVMVGGHLDTTIDGPGINDNGTGTGTILEVALQMAATGVRNTVRFAFWSGEELGLLGSTHYVDGLAADEREDIAVYLNFDMLGSRNFGRYVYDDSEAPQGSDAVAELLAGFLEAEGLETEPHDLGGASDHGPFLRAGIPVGGLYTGSTELMSAGQAADFGGTAGTPHDPCYHLPCDDLDNVSDEVLDQMADAVAHAVSTLAGRTDGIQGD